MIFVFIQSAMTEAVESTKLGQGIKDELSKVDANLVKLNDTIKEFGTVDFETIVSTEKIEAVKTSFDQVRQILEGQSQFAQELEKVDTILQDFNDLKGEMNPLNLTNLLQARV